MKYHTEHPKPSKMTAEESKAYNADRLAGYHALFDSLSEDEKHDPEARCRCLEPLMEWHREKTMQVVDHRKVDGNGKALLNKAVAPLIHQSMAISNSLNIKTFGVAVDCFSNNAILWALGWRGAFPEGIVPADAAAAGDAAVMVQPIPIVFERLTTEASSCDAFRRQLGALFLNQICLVLIEHGDETVNAIKSKFTKMSWKWANEARKYKLRIENWPNALRDTHPGPGFDPTHITEKGHNKDSKHACNDALRQMHEAMKTAYLDPSCDSTYRRIVSWTEDEMELDDPSAVPIALLGALQKAKKQKKKTANESTGIDDNSEEDDSDGSDNDTVVTTTKGKMAAKGKAAAKDKSAAKGKSVAEGKSLKASATEPADAATAGTSTLSPPGRRLLKCRYQNGEVHSGVFLINNLMKYTGEPTKVQQNTLLWSESSGKWHPLPAGYEPQIPDDLVVLCEVYCMNIALYDELCIPL
ncbi:hypothetical protein MVEN_00105700 [Mycena venus]|uniref:Uncharacterized protein n=1 Tax=Mycena venus TaxID=2733690 RepID=A0A8H7DEG6_9AGAR|nr:hypothetical protein MVEN_00105700 [Mycena venus]